MNNRDMLRALREAVRQAILVMDALGSNDARFLAMGSAWAGTGDDPTLAYGYGETRIRITPSAKEISQAETVAGWLSWLGANHGAGDVVRIQRWASGMPVWQIADREGCSDRTVNNRIDRSLVLILAEFGDIDVALETIEEPLGKPYGLGFAAPDAVSCIPGVLTGAKVFIGGLGWMRKRQDDPRWRTHQDGHHRDRA